VRAVPRKLIATMGVLLALALAGCGGGDKKSDSTAQSAATPTTTPAATTTTGKSGASKKGKTTASKISTATTDALPSAKTKTSGSQSSGTTKTKTSTTKKTTTKPKVTTTKTPLPAVTPKSSGSDLTSGTGSGPIADREDVVAVLRRYYTGFIERDTSVVCSLLTSAGQKIMIEDGNGKTCEDSVKKLIASTSSDNIALLQRTRDGLHSDDIKVTGNTATAQIGKTSSLQLVQNDGTWRLSSPNVVVSKS
jgi:hypothetical protein